MKIYLISLGAGLLVGFIYSLMGVRSPAPPLVALVGLLGILFGEQILPIAKRLLSRQEVVAFVKNECAEHVLGVLPDNKEKDLA